MNRGVIIISESGMVFMLIYIVWMILQEIVDMYNVFGCYVCKVVKVIFKDGILKEQGVCCYVRKNDCISYDVYSFEFVIVVVFCIDSIESRVFWEFIMQFVIGRQISCIKLVCIFIENVMVQICYKVMFFGGFVFLVIWVNYCSVFRYQILYRLYGEYLVNMNNLVQLIK